MTQEETLDALGAKFCHACGMRLPSPGDQCAGCGALPTVTRAELAAALTAEPGLPACKQAEALRGEAADLMAGAVGKLREADQVLHVDALSRAADYAQGVLEAAIGERKQAGVLLSQAEDAEAEAAGPLAEAYQVHQAAALAEEAARRLGRGPGAEAETLIRLNAAVDVLGRYKAAAQATAEVRVAAEAVVAAADAKVAAAEAARDTAAAAAAEPGRARMTSHTMEVLASPVTVAALEVAPLRLGKPHNQFQPKDVLDDDRVAFVVGTFTELGMLTGLLAAEEMAGYRKGQEAAEAGARKRPRVIGNTVLAATQPIRGGIVAPGWPAR